MFKGVKLFFFILFISIVFNLVSEEELISMEKNVKHIVLLGASVGKAWNFPELPKREKNNRYKFEYVSDYHWDKSKTLKDILSRTQNKPDVIILKECAAYFPGKLKRYETKYIDKFKILIEKWTKQCKDANVSPIVATVVPITQELPFKLRLKESVKGLVGKGSEINRSVWMESIADYNDWVRKYCNENKIIVLDLEEPLHISNTNRFLKPGLTTDGLHLNKKAYRRLDDIVIPALKKLSTN